MPGPYTRTCKLSDETNNLGKIEGVIICRESSTPTTPPNIIPNYSIVSNDVNNVSTKYGARECFINVLK